MKCPECGSHDVVMWGTDRPRLRYEAYARCIECGWRSPYVYDENGKKAFERLEALLTPPDETAPSEPETNADKLRSMSDEEFAKMWAENSGNPLCNGCQEVNGYCDVTEIDEEVFSERCKERFLRYLRSPLTKKQEEKEMNASLKPCPFCGSKDVKIAPDDVRAVVYCASCGASIKSDVFEGGKSAGTKWNIREGGVTLNDYQRLAQRTSNEECDDFKNIALKKIDNGILGLCGETGECADLWKKSRHQGHTLDVDKLADECGDVLWYVAELAAGLGLTLEEIAARNIAKLEKRYPEGRFEAERSINREE